AATMQAFAQSIREARRVTSATRGKERWPGGSTLGKLVLVGLASVSLGACGQTGGRIVVRVGAGIITDGELRHWVSVLAAAERPKPGEGARVRDEALEFLIRARWVEAAARSDHIAVEKMESYELLSVVMYAQRRGLP